MHILSITLAGFRSFEAEQSLNFGNTVGFYYLTGRNALEAKLGANGAGKSSLWDALSWCLFGKTVRGLRGTSIRNRNHLDQSTYVDVVFMHNDVVYKVHRAQEPNSLTIAIDGSRDKPKALRQEELDLLTGFSYETFLQTVVFGQFNQFFFDLSATEKLTLISECLELDRWVKASDSAKVDTTSLRNASQSTALSIERFEGAYAAKEQAHVTAIADAAEFDATRESKVQAQRASIAELNQGIHTQTQKHRAGQKEYEAASEILNSARRRASAAATQSLANTNTVQAHERKRYAISCDIKRIESELAKTNALSGTCQTCKQPIAAGHREKQCQALDAQLSELTVVYETLTATFEEYKQSQQLYQAQVIEADAEITKASRAQETIAPLVNQAARALSSMNASRTHAEALMLELNEASNPFTARVEALRQELVRITESLAKLKLTLAEQEAALVRTEYWVKGFKDLRLWLVDEALLQLELETNNSLLELGLHGWSVRFDIERENASGGVSKGFSVFIKAPYIKDEVPWEAWSGGETQRLRMAGALGFSSLIKSRRGVSCNLEIWDEPTAHLSTEGVYDLLDFLKHRADTLGTQIWLVDHQSLDYGGFDGHLSIVKTVTGSMITTP